jgi:tryptophan synthase beta subunit
MKLAKIMDKNENIVVTLSGRGDKDVEVVQHYLRIREKEKYVKRPSIQQSK